MKLNFILTKEDFLTYHLYTDSISKLIVKQKKKIRYGLSITYIILGILMVMIWGETKLYVGPIFSVVGVLWFLFYPKLFRYKRKRFYIKYVDELYMHRMNQEVTLLLEEQEICSKVSGIESKVSTSQLISYIELQNYFLIGLTTGTFFIVPKHAITDAIAFEDKMKSYAIPYKNALGWKWWAIDFWGTQYYYKEEL